jgi:chemotaxis protein methyltransferase CheR
MVHNRLIKRLRELSHNSYKEYIDYLQKNEPETEQFINALTTNKTNFFREPPHFDFLKKVYFKELLELQKKKSIYIWSAACSRGHEAYTLGMIFDEFVSQNKLFDYRILGTDIDTKVLKEAEEALYENEIAKEVPPQYFSSYFNAIEQNEHRYFKICDKIRKNIKFRRHNLIDPRETLPLKFDIIFLRNVLIYFPPDVIEKIIQKLSKHLNPGGLMFIGHSESIRNMNHDMEYLTASIYKKKSS